MDTFIELIGGMLVVFRQNSILHIFNSNARRKMRLYYKNRSTWEGAMAMYFRDYLFTGLPLPSFVNITDNHAPPNAVTKRADS